MTKRSSALSLLCAALFFLAFLAWEPFKPELLHHFANGLGHGWVAFASLRFALISTTVVLFFLASPTAVQNMQRTVPMPVKGHDPLLTLRAFACLLVFAGHGLEVVFLPAGMPERMTKGDSFWLAMGSPWAGVWVFFVLSGYLMAKGFYRGRYDASRSGILNFYKNRLARIAPIYYLVLLLSAIFISPHIFQQSNWWEIIALGLFSQQNGSPDPVISALWSIQTEMAFYAAVPLLVLLLEKLTSKVPSWVLVVAILDLGYAYRSIVMWATQDAGWLDRLYIPLIGNLDLFLLGMLANWFLPAAQRLLKALPTLSVGLLGLVPLYIVTTYFFTGAALGPNSIVFLLQMQIRGPTLVGFATFILIILFEHHVSLKVDGMRLSRYVVRGTQTIGVLTYALYAWHEPIFLHIRTAAPADLSKLAAVGWLSLALFLTALVAWFTYRLIEEPFEKRKLVVPNELRPN